jgi:hypothetical protein
MQLTRLIASLAVAGVLTAGLHHENRMPCTVEVTPFTRGPESTYLWGLPLSDTAFAGSGSVEYTLLPGSDTMIFGQLIEVREFAGAGTTMLDSVFSATARREVVVVLWDYDAGCNPARPSLPQQWALVGYPVYLTLELRSHDLWADGRPTFDSFWGGQLVYPWGALKTMSDSALKARTLPEGLDTLPPILRDVFADTTFLRPFSEAFPDALSASEVFEIVTALPSVCDWYHDSAEASRRVRQVWDKYADLLARYPGRFIKYSTEYIAREVADGKRDEYLRQACAA